MSSDPALLARQDLLGHLQRSVQGFAGVLAEGDLAAAVPGCPGWDLRALADHLGNVHRWARVAVIEGHPDTPDVTPPQDRSGLLAWYSASADHLLRTLTGTEPDAACWTLAEPRTASFWVRRQAHETCLHTWDAEASQGRPPPIDPLLAADGVAEVLTMFLPRQVRLGRMQPVTSAIALAASDTGGRWLVGPGEPVGSVRAAAEDLLLLLWKRRALDHPAYQSAGDLPALRAVLDHPLTP